MSWLHISTTEKPLKVKNWIQVKQNFFPLQYVYVSSD